MADSPEDAAERSATSWQGICINVGYITLIFLQQTALQATPSSTASHFGMIGPSISKSHVLPKTYTPRRLRAARWARPPATSEVLERALATRAAQRALIRWRIPTTIHEWDVPTVRSPIYRERPPVHWTTETVNRFWEQECPHPPPSQPPVARSEEQLRLHIARQAEMNMRLRRTLTALEPKTAAYDLRALQSAYSRRTPRMYVFECSVFHDTYELLLVYRSSAGKAIFSLPSSPSPAEPCLRNGKPSWTTTWLSQA